VWIARVATRDPHPAFGACDCPWYIAEYGLISVDPIYGAFPEMDRGWVSSQLVYFLRSLMCSIRVYTKSIEWFLESELLD
jgi:hypothetical protein